MKPGTRHSAVPVTAQLQASQATTSPPDFIDIHRYNPEVMTTLLTKGRTHYQALEHRNISQGQHRHLLPILSQRDRRVDRRAIPSRETTMASVRGRKYPFLPWTRPSLIKVVGRVLRHAAMCELAAQDSETGLFSRVASHSHHVHNYKS